MTDWVPARDMDCAVCLLLGLGRQARVTLYGAPVCWVHAGQGDVVRTIQAIVSRHCPPSVVPDVSVDLVGARGVWAASVSNELEEGK